MAGGGGMGRLVGVGFLVGAKDDGATETFDDVTHSVDRTADAAEDAGDRGGRGAGLLQRALEGIASVNLANISSTLDSIADRAGAGIGAQSTSLEQFGAQFNQTARAAEARLGSMGGAIRAHRGEVSSLAYTYGISGDEMFAAMAPLSRMGVDIEDTGISIRALAGHLQAGTVSGQAFGGVLAELVGTYDLEAEAAGGLVNSLTAIGDRFGFVAEIGQGLPAIMDAIRPVAARYPDVAANVEGVSNSIARLAAGMVNMGMAPEQALSAATATFSSLAENRDALENMVTGLGSDFPDLAQQIGISTGDIEGSIEAVMSSPVEFAQRMGEAMRQAGTDSVFGRRLAVSLREIGPEFLNVVRDASAGGDALARAVEPIEGVEDAFNRAGRGALTSTLTFQDQLTRMSDAYQTRLNSIGRATDTGFVQRQRDAYRRVGDTLEDFAGRDGPLGSLTRGFLRVRTFGLVQGLLPQLGILGEGLGDTAEAAGPVMRVMGDTGLTKSFAGLFQAGGRLAGVTRILGTTFIGVLGPIALVAGAGYLLYRNWDRLGDMWDNLGTSLSSLAGRFSNWVNSIDWNDMGDQVVSGVIAFFDRIGTASEEEAPNTAAKIGNALRSMFFAVGRMVGGLARGMWDRVVEWVTDPPNIEAQVTRGAQALGVTVGGILGVGMLTPLRNNIIGAFGDLFGRFGNLMTGGQSVTRLGRATLLRRIPYVGAIIGVLMDLPQIIAGFQTGGIVAGLREVFESVVDGLLMGLPSLIGRLTGTENIVESIFDFLFEGLNIANIQEAIDGGEIGRAILETFMAIGGGGFGRMIWDAVLGEGAGDAIMSGMGRVMESIGSIFTEVASAYGTVVAPIWEALQEAGGEIMDVFGQLWSDTLQPLFNDIWGAVSPVTEVFDTMGSNVEGIAGAFDSAEGGVRGFAEMAGDFIRNNVAPAIIWLAENVIPLVVRAVEMFANDVRGVVDFFRAAWPTIQTVFGHIEDGFRTIADAVTWWWENVTSPVLSGFRRVWDGIVEYVFPLVQEGFEVIADVVTWWWENITLPVLGALETVFEAVMGVLVTVGGAVFRTLGRVIGWWWDNVTLPVFNALRTVFVTVVTAIRDAGAAVFNFLAHHITSRLEEAAIGFDVLRNSWDAVQTVLSSGFRLIGARVQRFLTVPFIRFTGTLVGMADTVRMAFLGVKEQILEMFQTLLTGFQDAVRGLGVLGRPIAAALQGPIDAVGERISAITNARSGERAVLQRQIDRETASRQGEIDRMHAEVERLEGEVDAGVVGVGQAVLDAQDRRRQAAEESRRRDVADRADAARREREARAERDATAERRRRRVRGRDDARRSRAVAADEERDDRRSRREGIDATRAATARRGAATRRGARRAAPSAEDIARGLAEAVAGGPGSSRDNPNHVIVDGVSDSARQPAPRTLPGAQRSLLPAVE